MKFIFLYTFIILYSQEYKVSYRVFCSNSFCSKLFIFFFSSKQIANRKIATDLRHVRKQIKLRKKETIHKDTHKRYAQKFTRLTITCFIDNDAAVQVQLLRCNYEIYRGEGQNLDRDFKKSAYAGKKNFRKYFSSGFRLNLIIKAMRGVNDSIDNSFLSQP